MTLQLTDRERIVRVLLTWTPPPPPPICPVCDKPECKVSHTKEPDTRKQDERDPEREKSANINRDKLVDLMLQHNFIIPAREFDKWRATVPTTGWIEGVASGLECIATNGLLGVFLKANGEAFNGHVGHFIWDKAKITFVKLVDPDTDEEKTVTIKTKKGAPPPWGSDTDKTKVKTRKLKPKSARQKLIDSI